MAHGPGELPRGPWQRAHERAWRSARSRGELLPNLAYSNLKEVQLGATSYESHGLQIWCFIKGLLPFLVEPSDEPTVIDAGCHYGIHMRIDPHLRRAALGSVQHVAGAQQTEDDLQLVTLAIAVKTVPGQRTGSPSK